MLTVITGPPCAGKTTHVNTHRDPADLVVDFDAIAHALGYPDAHVDIGSQHPAALAARIARTAVVQQVTSARMRGAAWIIDMAPSSGARGAYRRAGAHIVTLDPGATECHRRATEDGRSPTTHEHIDRWYGTAQPSALNIFGGGRP